MTTTPSLASVTPSKKDRHLSIDHTVAALRQGDVTAARSSCQTLLQDQPNNPALHLLAATIALTAQENPAAEAWCQSCLRLRPGYCPALLLAGKAARAAGRYQAALDWFVQAGQVAPDAPEPVFETCLTQLLNCDAAAQVTLAVLLRRFPTHAVGWHEIGAALLTANHAEAAVVAFGRAVNSANDARFSLSLGTTLLALRRHDEAITALDKALALQPRLTSAMLPLAHCLRATGRLARARDTLQRLCAFEPDHAHGLFALGLVYDDLHDLKGAIEAYRACLAVQPQWPEAHVNLGLALQQSDDLAGAKRAYAAATKLRPDTFGRIAQALPSARKGELWLDLDKLRRSL